MAHAKIVRHFEAAGIELNGPQPWDPQVHDPGLYSDLIRRGSLALGEGYVQGRWNCDQLDGLFTRLLHQNGGERAVHGLDATAPIRRKLQACKDQLLNRQSPQRAHQVGRRHYDVDPRVYAAMLDARRIYSRGYWQQAQTPVAARKDDASAAIQAPNINVAGSGSISGGGGLIQTSSG
ncbi:hypothetical protein KBY65_01165 [Cyanobium sp. Alchichica 3B3-8F6]|uniref:hypothetical protein n=1 Tax=Cyanobium sp. Alchichica 3B3-8F6 TaxID=2823696 RepID=UPI0020CC3454|nr:hypothetical protein [Cyanobium sp. Alchichica 3B3-8F6]MCP9881091.1 hypothetical protein [Cyanobium sp. Alchichica 3B3-8F6]